MTTYTNLMSSPKSKRPKTVPSDLVIDSNCGDEMLTVDPDAQPPFTAYSDPAVVMSKYTKLVEKIRKPL